MPHLETGFDIIRNLTKADVALHTGLFLIRVKLAVYAEYLLFGSCQNFPGFGGGGGGGGGCSTVIIIKNFPYLVFKFKLDQSECNSLKALQHIGMLSDVFCNRVHRHLLCTCYNTNDVATFNRILAHIYIYILYIISKFRCITPGCRTTPTVYCVNFATIYIVRTLRTLGVCIYQNFAKLFEHSYAIIVKHIDMLARHSTPIRKR